MLIPFEFELQVSVYLVLSCVRGKDQERQHLSVQDFDRSFRTDYERAWKALLTCNTGSGNSLVNSGMFHGSTPLSAVALDIVEPPVNVSGPMSTLAQPCEVHPRGAVIFLNNSSSVKPSSRLAVWFDNSPGCESRPTPPEPSPCSAASNLDFDPVPVRPYKDLA